MARRDTAQKMKFSIKDLSQETAEMVTFTEEILNGKLHFLCRERSSASGDNVQWQWQRYYNKNNVRVDVAFRSICSQV